MKFVLTADWHLRGTKPRCRTDENWYASQENALNQVKSFANEKKCPIFVVGDIYHSIKDTTFYCIQMVQKLARKTKKGLYVLAGNHDLLYHSTENINRSPIGILMNSDKIYEIKDYFIENGMEDFSAGNFDEETENKKIIFKHVLCFPDMKSLPPNINALTAKDLLEQYSRAKWIFTGDYHKNFHYEKNGRHVVNPGCLLRQAVDFKDYESGFYFIDTDNDVVDFNPIIDFDEFVDDSYILKQEEREKRIEDFVDKLKDTKVISLDFVENVKNAIVSNDFEDDMVDMINELMEV